MSECLGCRLLRQQLTQIMDRYLELRKVNEERMIKYAELIRDSEERTLELEELRARVHMQLKRREGNVQ
jgi:hypothetical protein